VLAGKTITWNTRDTRPQVIIEMEGGCYGYKVQYTYMCPNIQVFQHHNAVQPDET